MSGTTPIPTNLWAAGGWRPPPAARPRNMPGMHRGNAPSKPIDPTMIHRVVGGLKSFLGLRGSPGSPEEPFFPPGQPLSPSQPGTAGRQTDYQPYVNVNFTPRGTEPVDFDTLRAIADPASGGYELIRLAIETRKDQMSKLEWSVLPRKKANQVSRDRSDERCEKIETLLRTPDGHTAWQQWVSQLIEEHLVIDAPAIYRRRSLGGGTLACELIDGATIKPILNYDGRRPRSGDAWQQVIRGVVTCNYTPDDLIYAPRNPRVHKIYGMSCVEQVLMTVNIGLRRQLSQAAYFTEGNIPDAIARVPPNWTTSQVEEFQAYWDSMVNDATQRRKMKFIHAGADVIFSRPDNSLVDAFDEWLARIIAYCFSLPPTPFVKMSNRATAESAYETALSEGLQPLMIWLKGVLDYILANWLDCPDLEFIWDEIKKPDAKEKEERDLVKSQNGVISIDDMRADIGKEPLGVPEIVRGLGPLGFMSVKAMKQAIENGWDLTGLPQAPMPGAELGAMDPSLAGGQEQLTDLSQLATGGPGDILNGLPLELRQALGVAGADQEEGQQQPDDLAGQQPGSNVVPFHQHPAVRATMLHGHRMAQQMAARLR